MSKVIAALVVMLVSFVPNLVSDESSEELQTRKIVTSRLNAWPDDFNAKNIEGACGLFAPDLVASYPGSVDRNYEGMCQTLTKAMQDPNRKIAYEKPLIEEIIPQGNICVVRLIWTLNISDLEGKLVESIKEKGLDVFQRQNDGSWKIRISYAYTLSD